MSMVTTRTTTATDIRLSKDLLPSCGSKDNKLGVLTGEWQPCAMRHLAKDPPANDAQGHCAGGSGQRL